MTDTSKREAVAKALDALGVTVVMRVVKTLNALLARRTAVQEPSAAPTVRDHVRDLTGATDAELDELGGFQGEPIGSHPDAVYSPEVFEAMYRLLVEANGSPTHALRLAISRAQVEPTDAQVEAALKAANDAGPLTPIRERLRAALRAAYEEGKKR